MPNIDSIDFNGTVYTMGGGVTSVNGKTGAVTVKEPTQKYIHFYSVNWESMGLHCTFYIISTTSPVDANLTSSTDFRNLLLSECTQDTPAICCSGAFATVTTVSGVGKGIIEIPLTFYVTSITARFTFVIADYSLAKSTVTSNFVLNDFISNTTYLYSVPLS